MVTTHEITVRLFEADDADQVAALIRRTLLTSNAADYPESDLEVLAEWYSARGLLSRLDYATRAVAVDRASGVIVGTAARRENKIEGFFVDPDWQHRGVGGTLLTALESDARAHAMRGLWLESSLTAVAFYTAHGFESVGEPRDLGDGLVVAMRKRLADA